MDKFTPQFSLDDLYLDNFSAERHYTDDGRAYYEPLERKASHCGVLLLDRFIDFIRSCRGDNYRNAFIASQGVGFEQFSLFVRLLTGMNIAEFNNRYTLRLADDLLRYTDIPVFKVAHALGMTNRTQLSRLYTKYLRTTPSRRRQSLRQKMDRGRYHLFTAKGETQATR